MFILTHKNIRRSAKAIANGLEDILGIQIRVFIDYDNWQSNSRFIRWGNSAGAFARETLYNSAQLINISANKLRFSSQMLSLNIPCVEINRGIPELFPVVIRKVLTGNGGIGIELCHSRQEFLSQYSEYRWSYWYDLAPELGVHIFDGKVLKVFKKVRNPGLSEEEFPIRNLSRGYDFSRVNIDNFPRLIPAVKEFSDKFPIKFGRMDVGWDRISKTYRIIEFNTAPGVATNSDTLSSYIESFAEVFK